MTYKCQFVDLYIDSTVMNDIYIQAQTWMHNAQSISILSPMFINNGQSTSFSGGENQQLLSNLDILISDYSDLNKIQEFLNNFPKNLNGYVLTLKFVCNSEYVVEDSILKISNFDAGLIKIYANTTDKLLPLSELIIDNCTTIQIYNINFENTNINIKNCKNIIFNNIKFKETKNIKFNVSSSHILIKNSQINLTTDTFLGQVTLNSKVYIHETCKTYKNDTLIQNEDIKKFNVTYNSQVTWFTYTDDISRLMNNQDIEFEDKISEDFIGSSNSFKNHIHASFILKDVIDNLDEFNSVISALPVGSTFYWPRAFRFSEYKNTQKNNLIQFNWENTSTSRNK